MVPSLRPPAPSPPLATAAPAAAGFVEVEVAAGASCWIRSYVGSGGAAAWLSTDAELTALGGIASSDMQECSWKPAETCWATGEKHSERALSSMRIASGSLLVVGSPESCESSSSGRPAGGLLPRVHRRLRSCTRPSSRAFAMAVRSGSMVAGRTAARQRSGRRQGRGQPRGQRASRRRIPPGTRGDAQEAGHAGCQDLGNASAYAHAHDMT